jgi:peptidoglycan/LPS O-acetylase OafA/YrhL
MTFKRTLNNSREIYVLRGIAIIFVFAYHLNIPGFSNGFVGVDIFLVSSGFLIHHIISQNPDFNITDFLLNRIRRIYPALLLTILLTILLFPYLLNQQEMRLHINSIIPAVVSFSNIYFSQNFDYFLSDNSTFPLLHLWSISLEFQFYLFFSVFKNLGIFTWLYFVLFSSKKIYIERQQNLCVHFNYFLLGLFPPPKYSI